MRGNAAGGVQSVGRLPVRKRAEWSELRKRALRSELRSGPKGRDAKIGAGNGIRTRDFDLGKVALYH
jgi:hypothetical protein